MIEDGDTPMEIGVHAFVSCRSLTSLTFPQRVVNIGSNAFFDCDGLRSVKFEKGGDMRTIGYAAFMNCSNLESLKIGKGVTEIGESAFSSCVNLKYVLFPKGLSVIGKRAFNGSMKLKYITIPESVTSLGQGSFWKCDNLVYVRSLMKDPIDTELWLEPKTYMLQITLTVPFGTREKYKSHEDWKDFYKIEELYFNEKLYDVTRDGELDEDDIKGMANAILENQIMEIDMEKADINHDYNVNTADLTIMLNLLNFGSPTPPIELKD